MALDQLGPSGLRQAVRSPSPSLLHVRDLETDVRDALVWCRTDAIEQNAGEKKGLRRDAGEESHVEDRRESA